MEQLERQSSFLQAVDGQHGASRLADKEPFRSDMNLWHLLLDYRLQYYRAKAISSIRIGLNYRGKAVNLSSEDEATTALWWKMLTATIWYGNFRQLSILCEQHGIAWNRPHLFAEVVGTLLRYGDETQANIMARRLSTKNFDGVADVLRIFRICDPKGPQEMRKFCSMHSNLYADKMYDEAMHGLWAQGRADDAFLLHKYLISKGDFPSTFDNIKPFMIHLATRGVDPRAFLQQLAAAGASFTGQGRRVHELETQEPGAAATPMRRNRVSDSFAAKAFATKALSFDFVLRSLQAFGLTQIGPQAIRELGLASSDTEVFTHRLQELDDLGIDTGSSVYSRLVRKLCSAKEHNLLQQALATDMHHEVFENRSLLLRLLSEHLHNAQWNQVNLLLVALNNGETHSLSSLVKGELFERALLQPRTLLGLASNKSIGLATFSRRELQRFVVKMLDSLKAMKLERRSERSRLAMARFTAGFMQDATAAVGHMKSHHWRLLLARLGQLGALDEVAALSHWIAKTITQESQDGLKERGGAAFHVPYLEKLYDTKYQAALMHWAMRRSMTAKRIPERQRWKKTLLFLQHLEREFEIMPRLRPIRKVVVMRCRYLHYQKRSRLSKGSVDFCSEVISFMQSLWPRSDTHDRQEMATALRTVMSLNKRRGRFKKVSERRIRGMKIRGQ